MGNLDNSVQETLWENFTTALADTKTGEAEFLLQSTVKFAGESAWEEVVLKMNDEWDLWLCGKSEFNAEKE